MKRNRNAKSGRVSFDLRGQSETIGVVLMLGMTLIGATVVVALGADGLQDIKELARSQTMEQSMTQFDSRAAIVGLGDTDIQRVPLGNSGGGHYAVDDGAGWVNITHFNQSGNNKVETIVNVSLGAVIYENGNTVIAYQGGGVWRKSNGNTTMTSPPEFHYRSATLTFPIIRVNGSGGAAGRVTAVVTIKERSNRLYPNASSSYPDGSPYLNPIKNGTATVTIHSAYYEGWADYFRSRSDGDVTVFHNNETVKAELISKGTLGGFDMPREGNSIKLRGLPDGHTTDNFTITLIDDDGDSADFSNFKWSLYGTKGDKQIEFHLQDGSGPECPNGDAEVTVYYANGSGAHYWSWTNDTAFQYDCESNTGVDYNDDGDLGDVRLVANFTAETSIEFEPVNGGDADTLEFSVSGSDEFVDPETWDEHDGSISWEPITFEDGTASEETSINNVTNHYMDLMGRNFELTVNDKSSDTVEEDQSTGTIETGASEEKFITFLHVTKNEIRVEFE